MRIRRRFHGLRASVRGPGRGRSHGRHVHRRLCVLCCTAVSRGVLPGQLLAYGPLRGLWTMGHELQLPISSHVPQRFLDVPRHHGRRLFGLVSLLLGSGAGTRRHRARHRRRRRDAARSLRRNQEAMPAAAGRLLGSGAGTRTPIRGIKILRPAVRRRRKTARKVADSSALSGGNFMIFGFGLDRAWSRRYR